MRKDRRGGGIRRLVAVFLTLYLGGSGAPLRGAPESREGKVLVVGSADLVKDDFLVHGGPFAANVRFLRQVIESFCLHPKLLELKRREAAPDPAGAVSPAMAGILAGLEDPVLVRFFASEKGPEKLEQLKAGTIDLLRKLEAKSMGRLRWEVVDPQAKGPDYRTELEARGISPLLLEAVDGAAGSPGPYSALDVRRADAEPVAIPVHVDPGSLEFELANAILQLSGMPRPRVVVFDGRRKGAGGAGAAGKARLRSSDCTALVKELEELFEVEEVALREKDGLDEVRERIERERRRREEEGGSAVPARIGALVVAQPHELEERQVYEIAKAVAEGIPAVFLVSYHTLDISEGGLKEGFPLAPLKPDLEGLFLGWGIVLGQDLVASRSCGSLPVPKPLPGTKQVVRSLKPLPVLVKAEGEALRPGQPFFQGVPGLVLPAAVGISIDEEAVRKAGLRASELLSSGKESYTVRLTSLRAEKPDKAQKGAPAGPPAVLKIKELSDPEARKDLPGEPRPVAVFLEGKFPYRYQGQPVPPWRKE